VPRQELVAATAQFEQAKALEEQARLRVERSVVRAPISGVAISRLLEPGEVLSPGAAITTLHRTDRLKAVAGIPESDIGAYAEGGPAHLEVDAFPGETFEGRIHLIAPAADQKTRTFAVEVAIDNAQARLRPGMIGRVSLQRRQLEDVVVVSRDVLQERDDGTVAVVLDGEVARVRSVSLGAAQGNRVVVDEGLTAGEWLIVRGHRGLVDGQKVAVVERSGS
jgi:membrane fusion protein (multidrug efflux system)